jgi:hypothetical protein
MLQEIADLLSAPKRALWSILPGLHDEQTGEALSGSQVAHNAFGTDPGSFWGKALGFGLDVAGDPLNLIFPFAARGAGALSKALGVGAEAGEAASNYSRLKNLRGQFGMLNNVAAVEPELAPAVQAAADANQLSNRALVGTDGALTDWIGNYTGPQANLGKLNKHLGSYAQKAAMNPEEAGAYLTTPGSPETGIAIAGSPQIMRHEMTHGIIDAAAKSGDASGLPLAMRIPATLQQSNLPFIKGLGGIADEAVAHAVENKGLLGQADNYLKFLLEPNPGYYRQIAKTSPMAAAMWQTSPYVGAAGLSGGSYLAGNALFGNQ